MLDVEDMYNHFEELKFNNTDTIIDTITKLPEKDLQIFVQFLYECIPNSYITGDPLFNFSTNASISGNVYPCACMECKISNLSNLAFFATLYAEKVIIPSPIDYHFQQYEHLKLPIDRRRLIEDIILLLYIKPLVLRRIIGFYTLRISVCNHCLQNILIKEKNIFRQANLIRKDIEEMMKSDFKIYTKHEYNDVFIYVEPKSDMILPRTTVCSIFRKPAFFKKYIKLPDSDLSFDVFKKLGLVDYFLIPIIDDFILHNFWNIYNKTTYLTNRAIDTLIMQKLGESNIQNQNTLNYIKPVLPLIQNVNIETLLKIRDDDYNSFVVYRDKLRELININNLKTEKDYQNAYNDLIQPEINKMNNILQKNRKHLSSKIGLDMILTSMIFSIGIYNNFSFEGITGLMSLLGISNSISDFSKIASKEPIEQNDLYFLWKINNKNKKKF